MFTRKIVRIRRSVNAPRCGLSVTRIATIKIAAWTAFWSETRATPAFRRRCVELQDSYLALTSDLCRQIVEAGGYAVDPKTVAAGLNAMVYGQWIEMHLRAGKLGREQARRPCLLYLKAFFPDDLAGLVRDAA